MERLFQVAVAALSLVPALYTSYSSAGESDKHTSSGFLKMAEANRINYIQTAIGIASAITFVNDRQKGQCISDWYLSDRIKNNETIHKTMRENPDREPRAVILGMLQHRCGSFKFSDGDS